MSAGSWCGKRYDGGEGTGIPDGYEEGVQSAGAIRGRGEHRSLDRCVRPVRYDILLYHGQSPPGGNRPDREG